LWGIGRLLFKVGSAITELGLRLQFPLKVVEVEVPETEEELKDLFSHSFATFKDGMKSTDYCTRHDAAVKLVGWYLHSDGHPLIEELVRAAEVLTEDTLANKADVSYLVGAWKDQASATTEELKDAAEERETKIYDDLKERARKAQVQLAEQDKLQ
jgi:nitrate reductase alpha subunit